MIDVKELRIGNFVYDDENTICSVAKIESDDFNEYDGVGSEEQVILFKPERGFILSESINPIQITEYILLKIGSYKFPDGESICLKNRLIGFRECAGVFYDKSTGVDLMHLHQLQNLFFAINGEELNIEL